MKKELKSCKGVLLRADLTGNGQLNQSSDFCQKGWDDCAMLSHSSKGRPCRIPTIFPKHSTTFLALYIKILETYFALLYFWIFAQCAKPNIKFQHYFFIPFQSHQEESSQIGYFIFVILSECDIHFRLPKHSKKTSTYQIIFKPNQTSKPNHGKYILRSFSSYIHTIKGINTSFSIFKGTFFTYAVEILAFF